jgi:hypothetical protein
MKAMSTLNVQGNAPQHNSRLGREARKPRKPPEPVHGQARWLVPMHIESNKPGRLEISTRTGTAVYVVTVLHSGAPCSHFGWQVIGFQMEKEGSGEVYAIDITPVWSWSCDCPDACYRERYATCPEAAGCKHVVGLRAALDHLPKAA